MRHNLVIEARLTLSQHDSGGDADKREENPRPTSCSISCHHYSVLLERLISEPTSS